MSKRIKTKAPLIHTPGRARGSADLWLVLPDIHFPDHDPEALEVAKAALRLLQPEYTLLLGDVLDCGVFSSHAKKTIVEADTSDYKVLEVDPCNALLDEIQQNTSKFTHFLEGNHENRIERWAANNGRVGESIYPFISPRATVGKGRKDFAMVPYVVPTGARMGFVQIVKPSAKMRTGGLVAVHGWSHAKHCARIHLETSRSQSIVHGHVHRQQLDSARDPWTGQPIKAWSPGTLSDLQPFYAHGGKPSEWTHGFSLVYVGKESWTSYMVTIAHGRAVLPDGKEVRLV